ncbi:hypothetical protein ACODT3_19145 [Streptomyces sp. 4.24]|uniref:DUF7848 domain-containing protein n=1 Tax=Streptomyces tritrimontium TaxID=3406573 RepID=UPI003BB6C740
MKSTFRFQAYTTRQDTAAEPEYSAVCVSTDQDNVEEAAACLAASGPMASALSVDDWMRNHMRDTDHRHFRRSFDDFAELLPTHELVGTEQVKA